MTPESPVIAELRPLLDAFCEGAVTPEQLRRLEELVLAHREAEDYYVQFMSFYADLIGYAVGLPEPSPPPSPAPAPAEVKAVTTPVTPPADRPSKKSWPRWWVAAAVLLAVGAGGPAAYHGIRWSEESAEARAKQAELDARRAELAELQAKQEAAQREARKELTAAEEKARTVVAEFQLALQKAHEAIQAKDFMVRLTGPAHVQPGAPNRWQIETLRHGAVARPKTMDVVVRDAANTELLRERHDKPVGAATLELTAAFWERVKPGADLFL